MTQRSYILLAGAGSAALLIAAFAFQHLGGLAPCKLCLWQRWPHAVAAALAAVSLAVAAGHARLIAWAGALAALATAAVGLYHVGVEQKWWDGPATCSSGSIEGLSTDELLDQIMAAPMVRCDEIAWQFAGLSMAGWNMVIALLLAGLWIRAATLRA